MRRRIPRALLADPRPLPPDAPAFVDEEVRKRAHQQQDWSSRKMRLFDNQPAYIRAIERVVGFPDVATYLARQGVRMADEAEAAYRQMIDAQWLDGQ